jgi:hypothetical protein
MIKPLLMALAIVCLFLLVAVFVFTPLSKAVVCHFMVGGC